MLTKGFLGRDLVDGINRRNMIAYLMAVLVSSGYASAVGILIATAGAGYLFTHISPAAPFVLFGLLNLTVCLWSLVIQPKHSANTILQ